MCEEIQHSIRMSDQGALLQCVVGYWHIAAFAALQKFGRYWTNNGQILILASDGCDANDPLADIDRPLYDLCLHPGEWMAGVSVDEMVDAIQPNKSDHD